jgi:hypothetical protein
MFNFGASSYILLNLYLEPCSFYLGQRSIYHLECLAYMLPCETWVPMGTHGSPLTRVLEVPVKWTQPAGSPVDLQVGPETLSTVPPVI